VAHYFGLSPDDLSSRSRHWKVLYPRQIAMYLSRKYTHEPLKAVGTLYRRDHSSVVYAVRSLKKKIARNPRMEREVLFIEEKLLQSG
jgi:chromosomal replication initiator protein